MKKIHLSLIGFALLGFLLQTSFLDQATAAQRLKKVAVLPFEVFAEKNAPALQKQLQADLIADLLRTNSIQIASRDEYATLVEGKRADEGLAAIVGKKIDADYVVIGSLTQLGKSFSIDARIVDIKTKKPAHHVYAQGGAEGLSKIASQLADKILQVASGERRIAAVNIKGNSKIETNAISNVIKSTKGKIFSDRELSADIKAIYKMNFFSDVQALVDDSPEGKVITFLVQEKPSISEIRIKGNVAIETKEIEGAMSSRARKFIDRDKLRTDVEKIKALYINKGYLNVEIKIDTEKKDEKHVIVTLTITENARLFVKTISFEGNQAFTDKELRGLMETDEWTIFHIFSDSGLLKRDKLKEDCNKITVFYLNNGYINAKVGEPELTNDQKWIYLKIPISEGRRFKVGKVDIMGDLPAMPKEVLLSRLTINKKDHYDREAIMKDMDFLTGSVNDEGFAYADVVPQTLPHEKEQVVDVVFTITKGEKVYFNRIGISGNTKTRDKVIRRELGISEGDLYSRGKLKDSYTRLNRLKYFEEVDFQTEKGADKNLMDVNVRVKEKPTGMFSIGGGYSGVDGAIFFCLYFPAKSLRQGADRRDTGSTRNPLDIL